MKFSMSAYLNFAKSTFCRKQYGLPMDIARRCSSDACESGRHAPSFVIHPVSVPPTSTYAGSHGHRPGTPFAIVNRPFGHTRRAVRRAYSYIESPLKTPGRRDSSHEKTSGVPLAANTARL